MPTLAGHGKRKNEIQLELFDMEFAKAMRYGGELIKACECDYDDFKSLIPLCPNCSEPVFLRKGSDRVSKLGKDFKIPQHWSHFDSSSEEQKAACEARVSGYTEVDRKRIQSKARGQRLKLIQRWFWKLWTTFSLSEWESTTAWYSPDFGYLMDGGLVSSDPETLTWSKDISKDFEEFLMQVRIGNFKSAEDPEWGTHSVPEMVYDSEHQWLETQCIQNKKTSIEALNFVASAKQRQMALAMFTMLSILRFWNLREGYHQDKDKSLADYDIIYSKISADFILQILNYIPWASEFARLEAENLTTKLSA